jgi:ABC-type branched-subunit amino acid transport system substrate-binding protein
MVGPLNRTPGSSDPGLLNFTPRGPSRRTALGLILGAPLLGACAGGPVSNPFAAPQPDGPAGPQQQPLAVGTGQVKVGLVLPLSASGNAGVAAQSMKNAAEMALAEFQNPNIQLLIKDDGGSPQGAQQVTQQALGEGAEIILGPLFAGSVPATAQLTRAKGVPVIAFSTDSSVAGRGVYLLSFLPESDVNRIVDYSASIGKKSFAALLPDNAYGNVVEAAFKQAAGRKGRIVAFEKYGTDRPAAARTVAQSLGAADALFIADDGDSVVASADALTAAGANLRNIQLLGTGLWDNPRVSASPVLQGGLYAAPDPSGFRSFAGRYRAKYGGEPVRTATLAYDAVALVAALSKQQQGPQRFAPETLTNPSGFAGIDGLFRFRSDGTNERGLAVMKVESGGGTPVAGSPKSFGA